ncbi:hypothetical protein GLYMA_14G126600v4 [Glycine max]|uniref:Uncharacterized protein n=1 Tax=Glycine max TaxID=3847 RepID=K7M6D9_SOYBN|nr:hypothetical protein GYH30_039785 [Glycine max]KRH16014.1 hypothetical protein GLYMA_14G126600v4 [Glycine max]
MCKGHLFTTPEQWEQLCLEVRSVDVFRIQLLSLVFFFWFYLLLVLSHGLVILKNNEVVIWQSLIMKMRKHLCLLPKPFFSLPINLVSICRFVFI